MIITRENIDSIITENGHTVLIRRMADGNPHLARLKKWDIVKYGQNLTFHDTEEILADFEDNNREVVFVQYFPHRYDTKRYKVKVGEIV